MKLINKKGFQLSFTAVIKDKLGNFVDLTAYDGVKFIMSYTNNGENKVNATALFINKANGKVGYTFTATDVNTVGSFRGYFALSSSGVKKLASPTRYFDIEITDDLLS